MTEMRVFILKATVPAEIKWKLKLQLLSRFLQLNTIRLNTIFCIIFFYFFPFSSHFLSLLDLGSYLYVSIIQTNSLYI